MNPLFIVTGASRGFGAAIVQSILECNPKSIIIATARSKSGLSELKHSQNSKCQIHEVVGDITNEDTVDQIKKTAQTIVQAEQAIGINALVHNAGTIEPLGPLLAVNNNELKRIMDVNVTSVVNLTRVCIEMLRKSKGKVIAISSGASATAYGGMGAYCMSKAALNMFIQALNVDEPLISAVAVRPGVLDTEMQKVLRDAGKGGKLDPNFYKYINGLYESKKLVDPKDAAAFIAKLCFNDIPANHRGKLIDWQVK